MNKAFLIVVLFLLLLTHFGSASQDQQSVYTVQNWIATDIKVLINEIELNPTGDNEDNQWIELFNAENEPIDISHWSIMVDFPNVEALDIDIPAGTILSSGQHLVIAVQNRQLLSEDGQVIELCDTEERVVDQAPPFADTEDDDHCWARAIDGRGEWQFNGCTKGQDNTDTDSA